MQTEKGYLCAYWGWQVEKILSGYKQAILTSVHVGCVFDVTKTNRNTLTTCNRVFLERQTSSPLPTSSPSFYCWAQSHIVWNNLSISWDQLSQLCPCSTSCAPPASVLVGHWEKKKRPWHCTNTAQQQPEHPCVVNTLLVTLLKHTTVQAVVKETNSIPIKTSILN